MNPTRRVLGALSLAALLVAMPAAAESTEPSEPADSAEVDDTETLPLRVYTEDGGYVFRVEVARTLPERGRGLMEREHLDQDAGMLFLYASPQPRRSGFWMYRTRIPLDIAFFDVAGHIVSLHTMQPCESERPGDCPVTYPGGAYHAALEVNAGTFEALGVEEGDCISWPGSGSQCGVNRDNRE